MKKHMIPALTLSLVCACVFAWALPMPAVAAWQQAVGGANPLNNTVNQRALCVDIANVSGVPWVSWIESNGTSDQTRVARLNGDGTDWIEPVLGTNPLNETAVNGSESSSDFCGTSIVEMGGTPYVAWTEWDGVNYEVRVARLNSSGSVWERVGQSSNPTNPINYDAGRDARHPSLAVVGGVLHVAWVEHDGTNWEVRAARLNGLGTDWDELVGGSSPINQSAAQDADYGPSIVEFEGLPTVAWGEKDAPVSSRKIRAAQLNGAGTAWVQLVGGASPINNAGTDEAMNSDVAVVAGRLVIAWDEYDGFYWRVRVSRLSSDKSVWEQIVGGTSPIAASSVDHTWEPKIADIGGVPYVTWREGLGLDTELRVARPDEGETSWREVVGGASPINQSSVDDVRAPGIASIGGVPYVAWTEWDGTNYELRVSRLVPELTSFSTTVNGGTGATLSATVETYGVAYPFNFLYGAATPWAGVTTSTSAGLFGPQTVNATVAGLSPATTYGWRIDATDTFRTLATGADQSFVTGAALSVSIKKCKLVKPARRKVTCKAKVNYSGKLKGTVKQGSRKIGTISKSLTTGSRKITIKLRRKELRGRKTMYLTGSFTADDGQKKTIRRQKIRR